MENNANEAQNAQIGANAGEITGLQTNYPIILNSVEYQYFKTWSITRNDYVQTHETEAGTQEDVVTQIGRAHV